MTCCTNEKCLGTELNEFARLFAKWRVLQGGSWTTYSPRTVRCIVQWTTGRGSCLLSRTLYHLYKQHWRNVHGNSRNEIELFINLGIVPMVGLQRCKQLGIVIPAYDYAMILSLRL